MSDATRVPPEEPDDWGEISPEGWDELQAASASLRTLAGYCRWCAKQFLICCPRVFFRVDEDPNPYMLGVCPTCDNIGEGGWLD